MRRLLTVRSGRHPHEVLILIAAGLIGVIGMTIPDKISNSIIEVFGMVGGRTFYGGMFVFAAVALYGVWKRKVEGLMIERASLIALTTFFFAYGSSVLMVNGVVGLVSAILPLSFAIANCCRIAQIKTDLYYIKEYLTDHPDDGKGGG